MHLKRAKIDQYGPIRDLDYDLEPGLHLFHGKNESGKTLFVESIIKILLDGQSKPFDGLDRVNQPPAGFLILEDGDGEYTLPDQGYETVFPSFTPSDLQNAFVIRDFDLRVPRKSDFGNASYFREVTDRITGAQTQKIQGIRDELEEIGLLTNNTSSARLVNQQPEKLKDSRNDAEKLAESIQEYLDEIREEGILEKARRKRRLENELGEIKDELNQLEKAEDQSDLTRAVKLVDELEKVKEEIQEVESEEENEIQDLQNIQNRINTYRERRKEEQVSPGFYQKGTLATVGLFALSLVAAIVNPGTVTSVIALVLLLASAGFAYKHWSIRKLEKQAEDIVDDAKHLGISGDTLPEVSKEIDEAINSFDERKNELTKDETRNITQLQELFDSDGESIEHWNSQIEDLEDEVEEVELEWDEDRKEELKKRKSDVEKDLSDLEKSLNRHSEKLSKFDGGLRSLPLGIYIDVEDPRIGSVVDLEPTIDHLEEFVSELDNRVETATQAIEIFEEIEEEEEQEINHLFNEDSYAVEFFKESSNGNYSEIRYDESENVVKAMRADGRELTADKLSQGTYDLLYLAIRLKLAQDLLEGEPGFLILDDAFLHSDDTRILQEMELLNQLGEDGWQILYFSIRNSVREAVENNSEGRVVELPQLEFTA